MVQQARKRAVIPSWHNLDEQIVNVKRSRFSSTACHLPARCQPSSHSIRGRQRRFASDPGPRRREPQPVERSWTELKTQRGLTRSWTTSRRREARMRRYGIMPKSVVGVGDGRMGREVEVDDERQRTRSREETFKRNEDALAQLQSLLDVLSAAPIKDEVVQVEDEFIHPVILAGVVFLIMIVLLNLYPQPLRLELMTSHETTRLSPEITASYALQVDVAGQCLILFVSSKCSHLRTAARSRHHPRRLGLSATAVESRWSINDHRTVRYSSMDAERPRVLPIRDVYGRTKVAERRRTSRSFTAAPATQSSSSGMDSSRSVNLKQAQANFQYGRERPALRVQIPVSVPKKLSLDVNPSSLAAKRPVVAPIGPEDSPISDWSASPPPSSSLKEHSPSPSPIGTLELPPELIDFIISLVSLDEPQRGTNLLNCALVCRSWATAARRHSLCFRHITIPTNERWITFSRVLSSRRCTFRVYTETLSISGHEPPVPQKDNLGKRRRFAFDLPHLRTLTLNGSSGVDMKWMSRALELFGRTLVQLNVEHAFFADDYVSDGFVAFFSACPQLEVCSLRDIRGRGDLSRCLEAPPTKLCTLALTNVSELMRHGLLNWLSRFSSVLELKDVSFGALSEGDCPAIAYFLTSFRRTITSLKLRFSDLAVFEVPLIAQDAFCREVDLGVLSNLQRLELYLPIAGLFTQRDLAAAQVPALLSQIVSPHFVEVSLFVLMDQMDNLELVDWASVIEILNRRNFARMESIVVHGMSMMPTEEVMRMRKWLIDCVARKLRANVTIVCGPFS